MQNQLQERQKGRRRRKLSPTTMQGKKFPCTCSFSKRPIRRSLRVEKRNKSTNLRCHMEEKMRNPLNLKSLNHISLVCRSVEKSLDFYQNVLGFFPIRRPGSLDFDGAWLFNYGIGIHLLQSQDPEEMPKINQINPKDNHISFQCESMATVEKMLEEMEIVYVRSRVEESGINVDQLFFHDPDGTMVEICNCDNLPVIPLAGEPVKCCSRANYNANQNQQQQQQQQQVITCLPSVHIKEDLPSLYINRANLAN